VIPPAITASKNGIEALLQTYETSVYAHIYQVINNACIHDAGCVDYSFKMKTK
jgi:hypothetical protein